MAQIQNKLDINDAIADDMLVVNKHLPNFFDNSDQMKTTTSLLLSLLLHALFVLLVMLLSALGFVLPKFNLPDLPSRDIEFKLVQQESKPPINKNTKIRSDRDSQAGGKHDPKRPVSDPTPKGNKPAKPAVQAKSQPQKQAKPVQKPAQQVKQQTKPVQKTQQQTQKTVQKPVQKTQQQQVAKPQPAKPTTVKAPTASLRPSTNNATQGVAKPSAPKVATAPKSPFAVPVPASSPTGTTYKPAGSPTSGTSSGGSKTGTGAPAPKFSSSGGSGSGTAKSSGSTSSSYGSRGTKGSSGSGSGGNPSPGNPNGAPGIDAIKQPNWGPYMRDLEQRIKRNWSPPKGDSSKRVVITFTISRDGRLLNKRIVKSSGVPLADRAAMSAIEQTAPFRPLPPEFKGQSVPIEFTFDYNVLNSVMR